MLREHLGEILSVASLLVSAMFGIAGCSSHEWFHTAAIISFVIFGVSVFLTYLQNRFSIFGRLEEIANQHLKNRDVLMDGRLYINCTFENVTFVYNGGKTGGFDPSCKFLDGTVGFTTKNPKLSQMLHFLKSLRIMYPNVEGRYTPR